MTALHVAVDARDLAHDGRGIARYLRAILARFAQRSDVVVTLIERGLFGQRAPRDADVVWHPWNGMFFSARVPAVVTFHDVAPFRFVAADARRRHNEQAPFLRSAANANAFLADSHFTEAEVETLLGVPAARQTVAYLGVEGDVFGPDGDAHILADGRPYVLFVGTHEARKNVATLVAGWQAAFPACEVALVFTQPLPAQPAGSVVVDAPGDRDLARLYRGARLVAVPSLYEGFGLPLLEAMACGTAALAARIPPLEEVGGDACAWIDRPLDADAWAAALRALVVDAPRLAAARNAGLVRASGFSWDRCAEQTLDVLRRAAASGR